MVQDDPMSKAAVSARMRQLRRAVGCSQSELCRMLSIAQPSWSNLETGHNGIAHTNAIKLVRLFGISFDWIYRGLPTAMPYDLMLRIAEVEKAEVGQL